MNKIMKIFWLVAILVVIGSIFGGVASAKNVPENLTGSVADAENRDVVNYTSASESLKSDPVLPFTIRIYRTKLSPTKTEVIPFETYVKRVLDNEWPCEWYGIWPDSCWTLEQWQ